MLIVPCCFLLYTKLVSNHGTYLSWHLIGHFGGLLIVRMHARRWLSRLLGFLFLVWQCYCTRRVQNFVGDIFAECSVHCETSGYRWPFATVRPGCGRLRVFERHHINGRRLHICELVFSLDGVASINALADVCISIVLA